VSTVGRAEGVVDIKLSFAEKLFCESGIVFFFFGMKAHIFQKQNFTSLEFVSGLIGDGTDAIRGKKNGATQKFAKVCGYWTEGVLFDGLPLWPAKVAAENK
jgi:hypothetical protein